MDWPHEAGDFALMTLDSSLMGDKWWNQWLLILHYKNSASNISPIPVNMLPSQWFNYSMKGKKFSAAEERKNED